MTTPATANPSRFARTFVVLSGVVLVAIGAVMIVDPAYGARLVGLAVTSVDAHSELRSIYGGMHLAFGAFTIGAALRARHVRAALILITLMTGGYVVGRLVSVVADGVPGGFILGALALEVGGALTGSVLLVAMHRAPRRGGSRA